MRSISQFELCLSNLLTFKGCTLIIYKDDVTLWFSGMKAITAIVILEFVFKREWMYLFHVWRSTHGTILFCCFSFCLYNHVVVFVLAMESRLCSRTLCSYLWWLVSEVSVRVGDKFYGWDVRIASILFVWFSSEPVCLRLLWLLDD